MLSHLAVMATLAAGALATDGAKAAWDLEFMSANKSLPKVV